jgi:hypothetical protein
MSRAEAHDERPPAGCLMTGSIGSLVCNRLAWGTAPRTCRSAVTIFGASSHVGRITKVFRAGSRRHSPRVSPARATRLPRLSGCDVTCTFHRGRR